MVAYCFELEDTFIELWYMDIFFNMKINLWYSRRHKFRVVDKINDWNTFSNNYSILYVQNMMDMGEDD